MDTMEYKGYLGSVHYSADDRVLFGEILGIDDLVNFEGDTVDQLERAFHEAVDDYLALCAKVGKKPERAYSGNVPLRIDPDLHRSVAIAAKAESKSLNGWISEKLQAATSGRVVGMMEALRASPESKDAGGSIRNRAAMKRRQPKRSAAKKKGAARKRA